MFVFSGPLLLQPKCLPSSFCMVYFIRPLHPLPAASGPWQATNHCIACPRVLARCCMLYPGWHTLEHDILKLHRP
jgi:hypothetical protein